MTPPLRYRPEVLGLLARHGIVPGPEIDPGAVYELLKSIYTFEIKVARVRWRTSGRPLAEYRARIATLRRSYPLLEVPPRHWLESPADGS